ncbi:hypothetical protein MOQ72_41725 [Saccharopolyspora sp. K220]|uniref:hypothetical protein n=1 Tax=Saccharopolyspora soli TaxID=2926618 RepID=UPI001F568EB5|nr:hypothetical protein [Saccharopolyspora soli]MCI2423939.1 hypothetical protein [Saccharopolyspora soli]
MNGKAQQQEHREKAGKSLSQQEPSFEHDIRPLFRPEDIEAMSGLFDLSSYQDVRSNADKIYEELSNGSMPCDEAWPAERVQLFESWINTGYPR